MYRILQNIKFFIILPYMGQYAHTMSILPQLKNKKFL